MAPLSPPTSQPDRSSVAWRNPYVWLVVAGPLVVVVASLFTFWLAVHIPDPPLPLDRVQGQSGSQAATPMQPALQGRNHAASPLSEVQTLRR